MIIISLKYISSDLKRYNKNSGVKWSEIGKKMTREKRGRAPVPAGYRGKLTWRKTLNGKYDVAVSQAANLVVGRACCVHDVHSNSGAAAFAQTHF